MCGRFALGLPAKNLAEHFRLSSFPDFPPRYNISPTQYVPTVTLKRGENERECVMRRWGLIPRWAGNARAGTGLINAKAETLAEKPSFREAFRYRRCLVPATGFFEWNRDERPARPYFVRRRDGAPFAFAGLWERRDGRDGGTVESFAIITTSANEAVRPIHHRMPVILRRVDYDVWLGSGAGGEALESLLTPFPPGELVVYPVSGFVNDPKHEGPECVRPSP